MGLGGARMPLFSDQVAELAQRLSPQSTDLQLRHHVIPIAETEPLLQKIRAERLAILQRIAAPAATNGLPPGQARAVEPALELLAIDRVLIELERLERYQHRLVRRRCRDLRALIEAQRK